MHGARPPGSGTARRTTVTAVSGEPNERRRPKRPCDYLADGEWPEGQLTNDAPPEAYLAQGISRNAIRYLKGSPPPKEIAEDVGVSFQTLYNVIKGKTWAGLIVIARLEHYLNRRLWGNEHRQRPRRRPEPATATRLTTTTAGHETVNNGTSHSSSRAGWSDNRGKMWRGIRLDCLWTPIRPSEAGRGRRSTAAVRKNCVMSPPLSK